MQVWDERRLLLVSVVGREVSGMPAYCLRCEEAHSTGDNQVCEKKRKEGVVHVTRSVTATARMAAKSSKDEIGEVSESLSGLSLDTVGETTRGTTQKEDAGRSREPRWWGTKKITSGVAVMRTIQSHGLNTDDVCVTGRMTERAGGGEHRMIAARRDVAAVSGH